MERDLKQRGTTILTSSPVESVQWDGANGVQLTIRGESGKSVCCDHVVFRAVTAVGGQSGLPAGTLTRTESSLVVPWFRERL